jgi:hypothetical protein
LARPSVQRATAAVATAAALALAAAALAAPAPTVTTDQPCYLQGGDVDFAGIGFPARARYRVTLAGRQVAAGTVTQFGAVGDSFRAPALATGVGERAFALAVAAGGHSASTQVYISRFSARFQPTTGDPNTLLVRFHLFGFGRARTLYLHYLGRRGRLRTTVKLGATRGACGRLETARRRLFPFRPGTGTWRLQFDSSRRYSRKAVPRIRLAVPIVRS